MKSFIQMRSPSFVSQWGIHDSAALQESVFDPHPSPPRVYQNTNLIVISLPPTKETHK